MDEHISDNVLHSYYKSLIRRNHFDPVTQKFDMDLFISHVNCFRSVARIPGTTPGVFLMANNDSAKLFGVVSCKSPWSCPSCSARKMANHARKIAQIIEAMKSINKVGVMITLSIPHVAKFSCRQVFDMLQKSWYYFHRYGHKIAINNCNAHVPFVQFCTAANCEHQIKVCEFTYGKNGWHPHYHCLFFVDKDKLNLVNEYEQKLTEQWIDCGRRAILSVIRRDKIVASSVEWLEHFYDGLHDDINQSLYISRNKDGSIMQAESSHYICGWGADKELTGNIRKIASAEGHYTPHQILTMAWQARQNKQFDIEKKWADLYMEYARATFSKHRMRTTPNINKVLENWKKTESYTVYKKKDIQNAKKQGRWQMVFWFSPQQWSDICIIDDYDHMLIAEIIAKAHLPDAAEQIILLLENYGIDVSRNIEHYPSQRQIENGFFNVDKYAA